MIQAPRWSEEELHLGLDKAKDLFREERLQESLEAYTEAFDQYQGAIEDLLETSIDLAQLDQTVMAVLTSPALLEAFRYLAGPPISKDDLMVLAEAQLTPSRLRLDVWSRSLMGWIQSEALGIFCPGFADELIGGKAF